MKEVSNLARGGRFDYLLIEPAGISEPMPVAETFAFQDELGRSLSDLSHRDTLVTVVDGPRFLNDYREGTELRKRGLAVKEQDQRTITELLVDQVEFANVIILNKTDLMGGMRVRKLEGILRTLNPEARLIRAGRAPGWLKTLRGEKIPEAKECGISSFVFRDSRPFHPNRLGNLLLTEWKGVLRAKGFLYLANRLEHIGLLSLAGSVWQLGPAGAWRAAFPEEQWPESEEIRRQIKAFWHPVLGDRQQELVIIGKGMSEKELRDALEYCLLTDQEIAQWKAAWRKFSDPFPRWVCFQLLTMFGICCFFSRSDLEKWSG